MHKSGFSETIEGIFIGVTLCPQHDIKNNFKHTTEGQVFSGVKLTKILESQLPISKN